MSLKRKQAEAAAEKPGPSTSNVPHNSPKSVNDSSKVGKKRKVSQIVTPKDSDVAMDEGSETVPAKTPSKGKAKPDTFKSTPSTKSTTTSRKPPPSRPKPKIVKLAPPRPFPQVPSGSNTTGPYSQRGQGKNYVSVSRKLDLGGYLRRCKELVEVDGYVYEQNLSIPSIRAE